jgi:hypothetical protein
VGHGLLVEGLAFTNVEIRLHVSRKMVHMGVQVRERGENIVEERMIHFVEAKLAGSLKIAKPGVIVCIRLVVNLAIQCT